MFYVSCFVFRVLCFPFPVFLNLLFAFLLYMLILQYSRPPIFILYIMLDLSKAQKLLIVTENSVEVDHFLSLAALTHVLSASKEVTIATIGTLPSIPGVSLPEKVEVIEKVTPRKYVLSFAKNDNQVKGVQWQQNETAISFHISMDGGNFNPAGMELHTEGGDYDSILFFNVGAYANVESIFSEFPAILGEADILAFYKPVAVPHVEAKVEEPKSPISLGEFLYASLQKQLNKTTANMLLAAILSGTDRLTKLFTTNTLTVSGDLARAGADLNSANALLNPQPETTEVETMDPNQTTLPMDEQGTVEAPSAPETTADPLAPAKPMNS